jgi:hypothetical protein
MVCGPSPCEAPEPVVTLMPLSCSNSGSSFSYAPEKPPEINTFIWAKAPSGHTNSTATSSFAAIDAFMIVSSSYCGQI